MNKIAVFAVATLALTSEFQLKYITICTVVIQR